MFDSSDLARRELNSSSMSQFFYGDLISDLVVLKLVILLGCLDLQDPSKCQSQSEEPR
jgi:hypothetical protein